MGGSSFHHDDYDARRATRASLGYSSAHTHTVDIASGKTAAKVHDSLDPKNVKIREARDSDAHPVSVPIAILLDTTGSMGEVPTIIEGSLPKLMGHFIEDKASGKKYLGDGYPAILIGGIDDYDAMGGAGCLQIGQFESGLEIDYMLENLWITHAGGGTFEESYELGVYFMARHTVHDHMEKRGKKGYLFIIGDEHAYATVSKKQVAEIIGGAAIQSDMTFEEILAEAKELYHVFFIIPNLTSHYKDAGLLKWWMSKVGQQNILRLEDPSKICELIVSSVAICEQNIGIADLVTDGVAVGDMATSLVPLSSIAGKGTVDHYSATNLPKVAGSADGGTERL